MIYSFNLHVIGSKAPLVLFSFNLFLITSLDGCWEGLDPLCMRIFKLVTKFWINLKFHNIIGIWMGVRIVWVFFV